MTDSNKTTYNEIKTPKEAGGGIKYDTGKLDWSLLPWDVIETAINRFTVGASKYERDSWKLLNNGKQRYEAAMLRHFNHYKQGNRWDNDPAFEGHPSTHLQAALWNMMCLVWFELQDIKAEASDKPTTKAETVDKPVKKLDGVDIDTIKKMLSEDKPEAFPIKLFLVDKNKEILGMVKYTYIFDDKDEIIGELTYRPTEGYGDIIVVNPNGKFIASIVE